MFDFFKNLLDIILKLFKGLNEVAKPQLDYGEEPMYKFSARSKAKLDTCHRDLQALFYEVIRHYDCTIICGHRGKEEQNEAYNNGLSKLEYPESKHNKTPSLAVDVAPYNNGIDWNDREAFYHFSGFVKGVAATMGINIRCGSDWDGDNDLHDQSFMDLPHFELK